MAAFDWGKTPNCLQNNDVASIVCLEPLFKNIVFAVISLAGMVLFVMLLFGGFNYLFSGGDQKKLEQARNTITNAFIGLVVIVTAYLILYTIYAFTGVDVTKFQINISH